MLTLLSTWLGNLVISLLTAAFFVIFLYQPVKVEGTSMWPGLEDHQLNEGRDLALTTDFRSVLGEVLAMHLGVKDLRPVFPGFDNNPHKFAGLIRA